MLGSWYFIFCDFIFWESLIVSNEKDCWGFSDKEKLFSVFWVSEKLSKEFISFLLKAFKKCFEILSVISLIFRSEDNIKKITVRRNKIETE